MRLFNRSVKLYVYVGSQRYVIEKDEDTGNQLKIDFSIDCFSQRGKKSPPNTAKISVYNLNQNTRNLLTEEHQAVEFFAGYGPNVGMIFSGQTTNVVHEPTSTGYITHISAGDGIKEFETKYFNKSYSARTLLTVILADLCNATGLPSTIDIFPTETLLRGETFTGRVKDQLDRICNDRGLQWSIQYGVIEVTQKDLPLFRDPTVVVLSSDTGLIGYPQVIRRTDEAAQSGKEEKEKYGIRAVSLMNYNIRPKRLVKIKSSDSIIQAGNTLKQTIPKTDANGVFIADIVRYYGSTVGGEFFVEVEADLQ